MVGSTRGYREWAVRVGENAKYRRPATPVWTQRLDSVFLHRTWGAVIFGERLSIYVILAMVLMFVGVFLSGYRRPSAVAPQSDPTG